MKRTGLVTMFIQAIFTLVAAVIYEYPSPGTEIKLLLAAVFIVIGITEFIIKPKSQFDLGLALTVYYLATMAFTLIVSNEQILSSLLWLILLIATGILFSYKHIVVGSLIVFASTGLKLMALADPPTFQTILLSQLEIIVLMSLALYVTYLRSTGVVTFDSYRRLSEKEKLQQRRLYTVINSINDSILNVSSRGVVRFYNAATLSLLDTNVNLVNRNIDEIFQLTNENGEKVKVANIISMIKGGGIDRDDLVHTYHDGQKINVYLSILKVRSSFGSTNSQSDLGGYIIIARDITRRKSLEDERDEFISVVSHELRTPVTIVEGALSNIQFALNKNADISKLEDTLDDAHNQVLFLAQMVNDLSTLSRVERNANMESETISIKTIIHDLYAKYRKEAKMHNLALDIDAPNNGNIKIPRMVIEEIMQNLIGNAIKYTKSGGVTVGAKIHSDTKEVEFYVRDTGIGISKGDISQVFQRFWRSEDYRTRETSGTGFGLHVVKQLAEKVGTKVEIKSRLNHGSTFSFRLPLV